MQKFQMTYFIPGNKGNWIVFACGGKGGCTNPLKDRYEAALGETVRAGFCRNELLWANIGEARVFTRDTSFQSSAFLFGSLVLPLLIVILAALGFSKRKKAR